MQTVCEGPRGSGSWEDCHPSHLQALGGVAQAESERESGDGGVSWPQRRNSALWDRRWCVGQWLSLLWV